MTIKAIETVYKGYKFRSRLEARWAVFFDAMGIEYQYELEGFDLGEAGWYLPDFYLPESGWFVEVKPLGDISDKDQAKIDALDNNPPSYATGVIVATGDPALPKEQFDHTFIFLTMIRPKGWDNFCEFATRLEPAVNAARQARFEHRNGIN